MSVNIPDMDPVGVETSRNPAAEVDFFSGEKTWILGHHVFE